MADPFQDPDAAGEDFIKIFADSMDERQSDPTMEGIVARYLERLAFSPDTRTIEVGAGAGAVTRRIARQRQSLAMSRQKGLSMRRGCAPARWQI